MINSIELGDKIGIKSSTLRRALLPISHLATVLDYRYSRLDSPVDEVFSDFNPAGLEIEICGPVIGYGDGSPCFTLSPFDLIGKGGWKVLPCGFPGSRIYLGTRLYFLNNS